MSSDIARLNELIQETTVPLRKGADLIINGAAATDEQKARIKEKGIDKVVKGGVVEVFDMPSVSDLKPGVPQVDCHFIVVAVDKEKAEQHKAELIRLLKDWPDKGRLEGGPSYIEVGGVLGDQGMAFQLYALGEVLGFWQVITPAKLGITGPQADAMAGSGMVMMTGFHPEAS